MRIVFLTPDIKKKLNGVGLEKIFLNTFLNADFLVIEEEMKRIIGIASVGGLFNIGGIFVSPSFRGTGLSTKLNNFREQEMKNRKYSFFIGTTYSDNPHAKKILELLKNRNARSVFSFSFSDGFVTTLYIQEFNLKGKLFGMSLNLFNSKIGTFCLASALKFLNRFWDKLFLADSSNYKKISVLYSVKNFKKV
jgi:hypothetical protein